MDLLHLIVLILVLGLVWWVITTYFPLPPAGMKALTIAFVVVVVVALLAFLGVDIVGFLRYQPHVK